LFNFGIKRNGSQLKSITRHFARKTKNNKIKSHTVTNMIWLCNPGS